MDSAADRVQRRIREPTVPSSHHAGRFDGPVGQRSHLNPYYPVEIQTPGKVWVRRNHPVNDFSRPIPTRLLGKAPRRGQDSQDNASDQQKTHHYRILDSAYPVPVLGRKCRK